MTDGNRPTLFGATYSVYTRIARLALAEKGVDYRLEEVDVFAPGGAPAAYLARHPFGRIPAFEHGDLRLYESGAIARYVDAAFPGPALTPADARGRARVDQLISVCDSYVYRTLVWDVFVERVRAPAQGRATDEGLIAAALPRARTALGVLEEFLVDRPFLAGDALTLADLHAYPMIALFRLAPEGALSMAEHPRMEAWRAAMAARPSVAATRSPVERGGLSLPAHSPQVATPGGGAARAR
ncbi:MAG: glutathione S-transferase family protein [Rhodospirillales bacterium]|nr:MAG: glutathione S-transferase family protein [Rhodospirillales bacterium]